MQVLVDKWDILSYPDLKLNLLLFVKKAVALYL